MVFKIHADEHRQESITFFEKIRIPLEFKISLVRLRRIKPAFYKQGFDLFIHENKKDKGLN